MQDGFARILWTAARRVQAGWVEAKVLSGARTRLPRPSPCLPLLFEEALEELLAGQLKVLGHVSQDRGEGADTEGTVLGDGNMMLATFHGGQAEMATSVMRDVMRDVVD